MHYKDFWRLVLGLLTAAMLLTPGSFKAQAAPSSTHYRLEWEKLAKELNLTPEKASEFQAIGVKYSQARQTLIENLKKNEDDLEKAIAAPQPDEAKIKELVPMIISGHNQLFESFKAQRQEEMTILTPLQQAKYLLALRKWHEDNRETGSAAK